MRALAIVHQRDAGPGVFAETIRDAGGELRGLWRRGIASTVDLLGEATVTAAEADRYARRCDDALRTLAQAVTPWPARPIQAERRR